MTKLRVNDPELRKLMKLLRSLGHTIERRKKHFAVVDTKGRKCMLSTLPTARTKQNVLKELRRRGFLPEILDA